MLDEKAWITVSALFHAKGQAIQVLPHQTLPSMSLLTLLCALVHSCVGRGRDQLKTAPTKLGPLNCPKCLGLLKHPELLLLELMGQAHLLKNDSTP